MSDLRDELEQIRNDYGRLTPQAVIDAARADDHPLHTRFEWNDEIAGEKFRLQQARALIRVVRERFIDGSGDPQTVRVYHSIPDSEGHAYRPVDEVVENPLTRKLLLQQMERDWRQLRVRYQRFREFSDLVLTDLAKQEPGSEPGSEVAAG